MIEKDDALYKDFSAVKKISIVPSMLDTICRLTGLGFAAVARVTQDRWLACTVLDQVNFGLKEGAELKIETTICNEIRDSRKAVVIDHVDEDPEYFNHHTPKLYGLQSYISFPIILKNGEFFGTLCAIGTEPALLNDAKITGTFKLFAELLSFHLQSIDLMEKSFDVLQDTKRRLASSHTENQHYQQITQHNFQEQIRKINLFSDILLNSTVEADTTELREAARKINTSARELSNLVHHINAFSELSVSDEAFVSVDLNRLLGDVCQKFQNESPHAPVTFSHDQLPVVQGQAGQLHALFYQLISYMAAIGSGNASELKTSVNKLSPAEVNASLPLDKSLLYAELSFEYRNREVEEHHLDHIFDIIVHAKEALHADRYESGLAASRKIIEAHKGYIHAGIVPGKTLTFRVALPLNHH